MTKLQLTSRLNAVRQRLIKACEKASRPQGEVTLLAVSKTKPLADVIVAYNAGQRHFAENYAQEAIEKRQKAPFSDSIWHFIGPLQSNKTRPIAEHYDWVHTIDRLKIAQRLSYQRPDTLPPLQLLIQVNISKDPAKSGVLLSQVEKLAEQIAELPKVTFRGLMAIPEADLTSDVLAAQFSELKNLQLTLINKHPQCTELSMGMSNDFEIAIANGATMVRVGSDIFGYRNAPRNPTGEM